MKGKISPPLAKVIDEALEKFATRHSKKGAYRRLIPRSRKDEGEVPYLYRSFLGGGETPDKEPGLMLHKFVASDQDGQLHNHPWRWAVSFILLGRYRETRSNPRNSEYKKTEKVSFLPPQVKDFEPGDINFIGRDNFHRVELLTPEVWTLFLHGPRTGYWGFAEEEYEKEVPYKVITTKTFHSRRKVARAAR